MSKSPWFKFYCSDFLLDEKVSSLPLDAQAILVRMWCILWLHGRLPSDIESIGRLCGVSVLHLQKHMQTIMQMLVKDADGFLLSERMEHERQRSTQISAVRRAAAEVSHSKDVPANGHAKQPANGHANGSAKTMQSDSDSEVVNLFKQNSSKKGTRLPQAFVVSQPHREFSSKNHLPSPDDLIDEFRDYWNSQPGAKGVKLDWDATFRNWIRNSVRMSRSKTLFSTPVSSTPTGGLEQIRAHRAANGFKN